MGAKGCQWKPLTTSYERSSKCNFPKIFFKELALRFVHHVIYIVWEGHFTPPVMCLWGQVSQFHFSPEFDFLISAAFHANETLEITEHFDPVTNGCLTFWHFPSVTVSLEAQMVSGSEVGESHSMEYIHIPKKGLLVNQKLRVWEGGKKIVAHSPSVLDGHNSCYQLSWMGLILKWNWYCPERMTHLVRPVQIEQQNFWEQFTSDSNRKSFLLWGFFASTYCFWESKMGEKLRKVWVMSLTSRSELLWYFSWPIQFCKNYVAMYAGLASEKFAVNSSENICC